MATSGTSTFAPTFDDILQDAAGMVGGGPILAEELQSAMRGMDYLLTSIQNRNVLLHKIETTVVPVSTSVASVSFDQTVSDALLITTQVSSNSANLSMERLGFQAWAAISNKTQAGRPTQYWFDRDRDSSRLYVWPLPNQTYNLTITLQKNAEDTFRAFNNVDVPRRFLPAILYGLAYYVGSRRPSKVDAATLARIKGEYDTALRDALREDRERGSFYMRIGRRGR